MTKNAVAVFIIVIPNLSRQQVKKIVLYAMMNLHHTDKTILKSTTKYGFAVNILVKDDFSAHYAKGALFSL